jgi:hypothetical protein
MASSWREATSEGAQADLDALAEVSLDFAQHMLGKRGEYYPFAAGVTTAGEIEMINVGPDVVGEHPASTDVINALCGLLNGMREELRAAAIVSDVRLTELNTDAIDVALEHAEGTALTVQLPYPKRRLRRGIEYGRMHASAGQARIWPRP